MRVDNNFFRQVLPNGMTVIFEKRQFPLVSISAAVKFGSAYENERLKGMAHFIEHAVFKGTKKRTRQQIVEEIEKKGGIINAYTDEEMTVFWTKLRSKYFETGIDILADIMLNPLLSKKDIDMERNVILEEIKMYHDLPKYYVAVKLKEQLYESPFGLSSLGTDKIIKSISRQTLQKYHNIHYSPSNIVVSIVGDADVDKIWNLSKKMFCKGQIQEQIIKPSLTIKPGKFGKIIEPRKGIDQLHLALGFYMPSKSDKLRYAAEIFNTAFGVGMSSKLWQEMREKRGLAYDISSWLDQGKNFGYCFVTAGILKGKQEIAKKIILEELNKFKEWNAKELEETKEQLIGQRESENEISEKVADNLLREQLIGDAKEYYKYAEKISSVTLEDIKQIITNIKDYAFVALAPESEKSVRKKDTVKEVSELK
ncbi:MAG: pitrilysin family protein [Candidatus Pacearchaeota archaeon]